MEIAGNARKAKALSQFLMDKEIVSDKKVENLPEIKRSFKNGKEKVKTNRISRN